MGPLKPAGKVPYGEAYKNAGTGIGKLLGSAGNIRLSIENLNFRPESRYLFSSPEDFLRLQKGVGVLFDVGHAYFSQIRTGDVDYIHKLIDATAGRITEVHISDNDGSEDQHMLPGRGKVPIKDILEEIAEKQELPPLIIEASRKIHGYSEEDLKKSIIELSGMR
jgi:sugar phosphate isomerase/epimerase